MYQLSANDLERIINNHISSLRPERSTQGMGFMDDRDTILSSIRRSASRVNDLGEVRDEVVNSNSERALLFHLIQLLNSKLNLVIKQNEELLSKLNVPVASVVGEHL